MISILIASLITVVHYLVSILRNELTWNAEVETSDPKKYSVVNWLFHAMNVANAAPHTEDMDSELWDYCARFLLAKNEFQAWKKAFPKLHAVHRGYCMYYHKKPELIAPLHIASSYGLTRLTELLLAKDESSGVSAATEDASTPLHFAARNGHQTVARLLIEKGADVSAANRNRDTPLHLAALNGHEVVAQLLTEKGADVSAADKYGRTPLHLATQNGHETVTRLLTEKGSRPLGCE